MSNNIDLWPDDIATVTIKAPSVILREQASKLGDRTKNIVVAEIKDKLSPYEATSLHHEFQIVAPALNNYRYTLFSITHDASELYPLDFIASKDLLKEVETPDNRVYFKHENLLEPLITVVNEPEFVAVLSRLLSASKTRRIIASLLAQSEGLPPAPSDDELPL